MPEDPIVADVREARAQLVEAAGGSVEGLVRLLRAREREAGRQPVELPSQAAGPNDRRGADKARG